ncbi:MAG: hypothetical protein OEY95_01165 [Candidatus Bathyarchaeota archaeon]|nr:hypothetical protein [Candidatus Bathyarchaeota archaeon]
MPKKYYWTHVEEAKLLELWKGGITDFEVLAKELGRKPLGVKRKLERMGVVVSQKKPRKRKPTTTAAIPLNEDLLTHEKVLHVLAGAISKAGEPGLDKLEIMRLKILVDAAKTYDSVLEKFERWVEFEAQLLEMAKDIAEIKKTKGIAS